MKNIAPASRAPATRLLSVFHYHQAANHQPKGGTIAPNHGYLEWITGGRCWARHKQHLVELLPGDLLWHHPGDHLIEQSDPANPYRCLAVIWTGQLHRPGPRLIRGLNPDTARHLARQASACFLQPGFNRPVLLSYILASVRLAIESARHDLPAQTTPEPLRLVLQDIALQPGRPWPVADLAARCGWSVAHFHQRFRAATGQSPHQWLLDQRLRLARAELMNTPRSIKEIAARTGFHDTAAFVHAFRKHAGLTPGAFRLRCRTLGQSLAPPTPPVIPPRNRKPPSA